MGPTRVGLYVLLTHGNDAIVVIPARTIKLGVPATDIAEAAGLPVGELAGREFTAEIHEGPDGEMTLSRYMLQNDPRI